MSNKNPASRVVNIPTKFLPMVEKEMDERGCFTVCETMGHILAQYFSSKNNNPQSATKPETQSDTKTVIKGRKQDAG